MSGIFQKKSQQDLNSPRYKKMCRWYSIFTVIRDLYLQGGKSAWL